MSATVDATTFESYFRPAAASVGQLRIPGRTYPVSGCYLDDILRMTNFQSSDGGTAAAGNTISKTIQNLDAEINYDLIAATVAELHAQLHECKDSILIFLPGEPEITRAIKALRRVDNIQPFALHGSLSSAEQQQVFVPLTTGRRKVVVSTNIAETSITIEDVVVVIDSGRVKENSVDPQTGLSRLTVVWASLAACQQRQGRAGRVRPGACYKLFTRAAEENMNARPEPEMASIPGNLNQKVDTS